MPTIYEHFHTHSKKKKKRKGKKGAKYGEMSAYILTTSLMITYYRTMPLTLEHSYLIENLTNSKIAETKALEPLKS